MNGVHDMGGLHGLGQVDPRGGGHAFHAAWETRVFALTIAAAAWGAWSIDEDRHEIERIPGPAYLRSTYYERWYRSLVQLLLRHHLITPAELADGSPARGSRRRTPPLPAHAVAHELRTRRSYQREVANPPQFQAGDTVVTGNPNARGHTRLPRYARGRSGTVERWHGAHVFPDSNAEGKGEQPRHLYTVRFTARELWGEDGHPNDTVRLDIWEPHLRRA